jgi:hypothetical protein
MKVLEHSMRSQELEESLEVRDHELSRHVETIIDLENRVLTAENHSLNRVTSEMRPLSSR